MDKHPKEERKRKMKRKQKEVGRGRFLEAGLSGEKF